MTHPQLPWGQRIRFQRFPITSRFVGLMPEIRFDGIKDDLLVAFPQLRSALTWPLARGVNWIPNAMPIPGFAPNGYRCGRDTIAFRIIASTSSRSLPASGSRGERTISEPMPFSAAASLMYCTSFTCVSRWRSGVYQ